MTYQSAFNSICLLLGPVIATYFAFDINQKENGQRTFVIALMLNSLVYALKLTFLATVALALGLSTYEDTSLEGTSLAFQWGLIALNTLLSVSLETYAVRYVLT